MLNTFQFGPNAMNASDELPFAQYLLPLQPFPYYLQPQQPFPYYLLPQQPNPYDALFIWAHMRDWDSIKGLLNVNPTLIKGCFDLRPRSPQFHPLTIVEHAAFQYRNDMVRYLNQLLIKQPKNEQIVSDNNTAEGQPLVVNNNNAEEQPKPMINHFTLFSSRSDEVVPKNSSRVQQAPIGSGRPKYGVGFQEKK